MVDFKKALEEDKRDPRIGYCNRCDASRPMLRKSSILPAYVDLPVEEQRCKCPYCGFYQNVWDLIPF